MLAAGLALVVVGGVWGTGVFGALRGGGFDDPASESQPDARAGSPPSSGQQAADISCSGPSAAATVDDPAFRERR